MSWYEGKHALVTGGGSGIGAAIARLLADKQCRITITGRSADKLAAVAEELGASFQAADVTNREQVRAAFASAEKDNGEIDILVNNAGVAEAAPFEKLDDEQWDRTLAVNLTGVYNCSKAVIVCRERSTWPQRRSPCSLVCIALREETSNVAALSGCNTSWLAAARNCVLERFDRSALSFAVVNS